MKKGMRYSFAVSLLLFPAVIAFPAALSGCAGAQKDVDKAFEMGDELGRERQTKVLGRDVIVHPEADKKVVIPF